MTDSQALLQEGLAAFRARAYDQALRAWRTLLSFEPDHPQVKELVARTEALAAEGQIVHQLKEELADLREELATTRDSRNELLLEMARVHKRYEEREARLWRMQEAREWELREALATAELKSLDLLPPESDASHEELALEAQQAFERDAALEAIAVPKTPATTQSIDATQDEDANESLRRAKDQIRTLREELSLAHERIVELEQQLLQYEHDELDGDYPGLDSNDELQLRHAVQDALFLTDEEQAIARESIHHDPEADEYGFIAPIAFSAVESQNIETQHQLSEDALFNFEPSETQSANTVRDDDSLSSSFDPLPSADDASADEADFDGPLIADEVLNQSTSSNDTPIERKPEGFTRNLRRDIVRADTNQTDSFQGSPEDDALVALPAESQPVLDALVGIVIEETSGMIHVDSASSHIPTSPPSFTAVDADSESLEEFSNVPTSEALNEDPSRAGFEAVHPDAADAADEEMAPPSFHAEDAPETATLEYPSHEAAHDEAWEKQKADIAALPLARNKDDATDTAEIELQPMDDKNVADGFADELAAALDTTPEPPRLDTGIQPELPDIDFMEDEPEEMSPDELERRPTWIPVRHKENPILDDAVASYLLTHIDGVSTFMELRGTVGLPPAAVDSGFRTLLAKNIIRAKKR